MATDKPRFSISLDEDLFDLVEDYRHDNRISTRSKAVVKLVEKGIAVLNSQESKEVREIKSAPSQREGSLLAAFHQLNEPGQEEMLKYADYLLSKGEYLACGESGEFSQEA